jgi:putative phosphoesterase
MKLAFISDIHANLPALKAVLRDIQKRHIDDIYCLGDLVNFAGWDNEVIDVLKSHNISCIQGNHDEGIGYGKTQFPFSFKTEAQRQFGIQSISLVNADITSENRNFLKSLPFSIRLEFRFPFHHMRMLMVHGSPISNEDYVRPDMDDRSLLTLLEEADSDVLIMGHTHVPFHRSLFTEEENNKLYRHVINAGSVGKPKHGDNRACYLLLTINETLQLTDPSSVISNFHYVDYDTEAVIRHVRDIGLSGAYDEFLRTGQ